MPPQYLESYHNNKLKQTIEKTFRLLESCCICPRKCKVNRIKNEKGICKTGLLPIVYSYMPHHGEEPPISGTRGSGTIFFSNCNIACVYCQNYEFSQEGNGRETSFEELAKFMLELQNSGAHNINLVTPTHVMPQILCALNIAIPKGLKIPLVYNTGGYELPEIVKLLDGIIDVYLADCRYADDEAAIKYSSAPGYPKYNQASLVEMHRQVQVAKIQEDGIITSGVIIRHLVLPGGISGTDKVMKFISRELSPDSYVSLMSQYLPCYKAGRFPDLKRRITCQEYEEAKQILQKYGLENGWTQESYGLERYAGINIKPMIKNKEGGNQQI